MTERKTCTKESPMPKGDRGRWFHDGAHEVHGSQRDGWPCGDTIQMRCDNCGHEWSEELPQ